jgi:hypothetical protein
MIPATRNACGRSRPAARRVLPVVWPADHGVPVAARRGPAPAYAAAAGKAGVIAAGQFWSCTGAVLEIIERR